MDKLVEKILHCSCQACGKEPSHEGLSVYAVSYTHLTLPTKQVQCRSRWSPYH